MRFYHVEENTCPIFTEIVKLDKLNDLVFQGVPSHSLAYDSKTRGGQLDIVQKLVEHRPFGDTGLALDEGGKAVWWSINHAGDFTVMIRDSWNQQVISLTNTHQGTEDPEDE